MKTPMKIFLAGCLLAVSGTQARALQTGRAFSAASDIWPRLKSTIEGYLGRPYAWGATGLKSFDCSGLVWRVSCDNGIFIKRTTARKLYMCLPKPGPSEAWNQGNIVFFDDLRHCGIVASRNSFYHAQTSVGTNLSQFNLFWRTRIVGFRRLPRSEPR
jgi:cell wall-associated NlpC family hydrolase